MGEGEGRRRTCRTRTGQAAFITAKAPVRLTSSVRCQLSSVRSAYVAAAAAESLSADLNLNVLLSK